MPKKKKRGMSYAVEMKTLRMRDKASERLIKAIKKHEEEMAKIHQMERENTTSVPKSTRAPVMRKSVDYVREYPSEYTMGFQAYVNGKDPEKECPFTKRSNEREAWIEGWCDCRDEWDEEA